MIWYTYDVETFQEDHIEVFKNKSTAEYTVFHNAPEELAYFMDEHSEDIFCGFNSKSYDQFIIKAICSGLPQDEIWELNKWIIDGKPGWDCPYLVDCFFKFNNVDIRDDTQQGLSLKAIEAHLGLSIEESSVDFNIKRALTEDEVAETIKYCKHDVDTTEMLADLRKTYLKTKVDIGKMVGLPTAKALSMTNAKLTAALLQASPPDNAWTDERQYQYPANLKREYIPAEVFEFFDKLKDKSIPDDELFSTKLKIMVGEAPTVIGYGGIHAAIPNFVWEGGA